MKAIEKQNWKSPPIELNEIALTNTVNHFEREKKTNDKNKTKCCPVMQSISMFNDRKVNPFKGKEKT